MHFASYGEMSYYTVVQRIAVIVKIFVAATFQHVIQYRKENYHIRMET
jgi:hypothetical protein